MGWPNAHTRHRRCGRRSPAGRTWRPRGPSGVSERSARPGWGGVVAAPAAWRHVPRRAGSHRVASRSTVGAGDDPHPATAMRAGAAGPAKVDREHSAEALHPGHGRHWQGLIAFGLQQAHTRTTRVHSAAWQPAESAGSQAIQGQHRARSMRESQGSREVASRPTLEDGQEGRSPGSC